MGQVTLVTGPARSGKSEWAEMLAVQTAKRVVYVATAQADSDDLEWLSRIEKHQQRRPGEWKTVLVPLELTATLRDYAEGDCCLLVDSLGTWVANFLEQDDAVWETTTNELLENLAQTPATVIFVAEETGWGVVPAYPMGRTFRDRLGHLVRRLGAIANPVYLVTGGHILNLSVLGEPLQDLKQSLP
ncbi:bifunctional adenosylcobinamide kinase/adenosylcobinamide-phosphate guanylyltransferase [Coleofasciculus sp. LEGE 07081]|uniref:bifunctional adenosylcobinamide kinase/adenosylcobinamide-phosphate guanylyltransferase n=1 Tax=unclassified Coleofasciculus TaxID=2692782 RepID=UPI001880EE86|nr:bifunctional adenosylcobinamide kinase/adenosylcobinamide-phosphate guanylyltransferase [Coleofasciculus sp. LEGE 07081]MBE9150459.1 bifunctional adenosylcobinamide kinase/adenosylcobinamide-phosphate guanylyltransferase [Coleofasciculus sp. LEGE 07092]